MQRREMYVQIKASGGGDGQGPHGQQGLMAAAGGRAHSETTHLDALSWGCWPAGRACVPCDGAAGLAACGAMNRWAEGVSSLQAMPACESPWSVEARARIEATPAGDASAESRRPS
jgi:hypothetical protein